MSDFRKDKDFFPDLLYAKSFCDIAKAISTFSIGKVMDRHDYYLLRPYLPSKIKSKLPDDIVDNDMPEINEGKCPTIFIEL